MTRDQFLTEWLGLEWCDATRRWIREHPWDCFGKLWEAAQKDKEWRGFISYYGSGTYLISIEYINPDGFATEWAKFKGWMGTGTQGLEMRREEK